MDRARHTAMTEDDGVSVDLRLMSIYLLIYYYSYDFFTTEIIIKEAFLYQRKMQFILNSSSGR